MISDLQQALRFKRMDDRDDPIRVGRIHRRGDRPEFLFAMHQTCVKKFRIAPPIDDNLASTDRGNGAGMSHPIKSRSRSIDGAARPQPRARALPLPDATVPGALLVLVGLIIIVLMRAGSGAL